MRKRKSEKYYTNRHSCFLLQYHLVLITKYRHPVIKGALKTFLIQYVEDFFKKDENLDLVVVNTEVDHMHILFNAAPQVNLANMINSFKSASSRLVRSHFDEELKPYYWKPYFWSLSYFIGSVSDTTEAIVKKYIENQKG